MSELDDERAREIRAGEADAAVPRTGFAFGGQNGKAMLSLPGEACAVVEDWHALAAFLKDGLQARITRWDGAVDDFHGERTMNDAVFWYRAGGFTTGGNTPLPRQEGNWLTADTKGRTFYVGKRGNGKLMRIYEKGKQLGDPNSPWVRFEVELHNRDREIPFDVLLRPGHYVAGSYPCMRWVSDKAFRIRTIQNQKRISYGAAVHWASIAIGRLVNTMEHLEGSAEAVLEKLRSPASPLVSICPTSRPARGSGHDLAHARPGRSGNAAQGASEDLAEARAPRRYPRLQGRPRLGLRRTAASRHVGVKIDRARVRGRFSGEIRMSLYRRKD